MVNLELGENYPWYLYKDEIKEIIIEEGITSIGSYAFSNTYYLKNVNMFEGVTTIGEHAFDWCYRLTNVAIPDSVTSIGLAAFYNCEGLTSVTIGNGVTSIGLAAFCNCKSLESVYCKSTTPPTGDEGMFSNYSGGYTPIGCKIYVPASADHSILNAYKSAKYWKDYATYIVEYDFSAEQ